MKNILIAGIGMTPVGEFWEKSLSNLAARAMLDAIKDSGGLKPEALYVGNLLASTASQQANLGALLAETTGLTGVEAFTTEAAEAGGAAALRLAWQALRSGLVNSALVVGVEKYTDVVGAEIDALIAQAQDYDFEASVGLTPAGTAGLLMNRYIEQYGAQRAAFCALPMLSHARAVNNLLAMYRRAISAQDYARAPQAEAPLNLFDCAPYADGAAALLLVVEEALPAGFAHAKVRVSGSGGAIDALALHDRQDPLAFGAASESARQALESAGLGLADMDIVEVWDSFSITAALQMEAIGMATRGEVWKRMLLGEFGEKPTLLSMGGNKARGYPLAAAGVYQAAEAALQLRGEAGACQVPGAKTAFTQALGGAAGTAISHVFQVE